MIPLLLVVGCWSNPEDKYDADTSVPFFPPSEEGDTDTDSDTDTDTDTDTDSDTDTDTDTDTGPVFDCKGGLPPSPPYDGETLDDTITAEDLDIDNDGFIIGSDRLNLYRTDVDGDSDMIMPNVGNPQAMIVLPTDDIVIYQETGQLEMLSADGDRSTVLTGYYIPYGDVNAEGMIYASVYWGPNSKSYIVRIDVFEEEVEELMEWEDDFPWGITFNEDYTALYVSVVQGFDAYMTKDSRIYKLNLDEKGDLDGEPEIFVEFDGETSWTEGLAVDVCGNVYVSLGTKVMRVSKDAEEIEEIWVADGGSHWGRAISGLAFGREGKGGTDPLKLYASNPYGKFAYEIDAGVYGKAGW